MSRFNTLLKDTNLFVISDLHLGNPSFVLGKSFNAFLEHISKKKATLCINGDGLDLLQISFPKLMLDFPSVIKNIQGFLTSKEHKIYYVVGNHDIYLEAFLEDFGIFNVVPFLDVVSGNQRIHIEHGHLYDPFFLHYPRFYMEITKLLGLGLKLMPGFFYLFDKFLESLQSLKHKGKLMGMAIDGPHFIKAVNGLMDRGFDTVIFGHTHHSGMYVMEGNKNYVNSGSWIGKYGHYVEINDGKVSLNKWDLSD